MGASATPGAQAAPTRTAPSDEAVLAAARERIDAPNPPGLAKLLAYLQETNHWSLSEKRLKRLLTDAGLRGGGSSGSSVPASRIDDTLPLPDTARATYFDAVKGRGLLAARPLREGETLFVEDAFVAAPPPQAVKALLQGEICNHCFLPVASRMLAVGCRHAGACRARFCSRLCQERAMHTQHAVLCPGVNRAAQPLLELVQEHAWQSLHLAARATARALLARSRTPPPSITRETGASIQGLGRAEAPASFEETMHHLHSFATVSELDRRARSPGWDAEREQFTALACEAHARFTAALNPRHGERSAGFPVAHDALSAQETDALFSWAAFLGMLGRANLNMESHGGMCRYDDGTRSLTSADLVHSQLNHACTPNVRISHVPGRSGVRPATRITAIAARNVAKDEELLISYVDPSQGVEERQKTLWRDYCFGPCDCAKCKQEASAPRPQEFSLDDLLDARATPA